MPSFSSMWCTWFFTVEISMHSSRAISLLERPRAISPAI